MKYFTNIRTLDELKAAYRRLALKYHPDMGGSTEIMQEINAEHDALFEQLKRQHKDALKAAGCRWSNNKKLWYWHHPEEGVKWRKRNTTMSEIRMKYGSQVFDASGETTGYNRIGATA